MDTSKNEAVAELIDYFGSQKAVGRELGIDQATVSLLLNNKKPVTMELAFEAQLRTDGEIKAERLCPKLSQYIDTP